MQPIAAHATRIASPARTSSTRIGSARSLPLSGRCALSRRRPSQVPVNGGPRSSPMSSPPPASRSTTRYEGFLKSRFPTRFRPRTHPHGVRAAEAARSLDARAFARGPVRVFARKTDHGSGPRTRSCSPTSWRTSFSRAGAECHLRPMRTRFTSVRPPRRPMPSGAVWSESRSSAGTAVGLARALDPNAADAPKRCSCRSREPIRPRVRHVPREKRKTKPRRSVGGDSVVSTLSGPRRRRPRPSFRLPTDPHRPRVSSRRRR